MIHRRLAIMMCCCCNIFLRKLQTPFRGSFTHDTEMAEGSITVGPMTRTADHSNNDRCKFPVNSFDAEKRQRMLNYVYQRRCVFAKYEDYARLMSLIKKLIDDIDETRFVEAMREYVLCSQRVIRFPKYTQYRYEADSAFEQIVFILRGRSLNA